MVKTRLCLKDTNTVPEYMRYRGLRDGLPKLYRYEGLRGFYKGYFPGLLGVSHGAMQFMFYEELKKFYCNYYGMVLTTKLVSCMLHRPLCQEEWSGDIVQGFMAPNLQIFFLSNFIL